MRGGGKKNDKNASHKVIKTVFRTFSPIKMHAEMLQARLDKIDLAQDVQAQLFYSKEIQTVMRHEDKLKKSNRLPADSYSDVRLKTHSNF